MATKVASFSIEAALGTANVIISEIDATTPEFPNYRMAKLEVGFLDRAQSPGISIGDTVFTGVSINFVDSFGAGDGLGNSEKAIGLQVDVTNLTADSTTNLPEEEDFTISGTKIAALFNGGHVGISSEKSGIFQPSTNLHVESNNDFQGPL